MERLTVSLACCGYDRTRALFDGRVSIEGCNVIPVTMPPEETFFRAFRNQEFDITELSMSGYISQLSRDKNAYVAIPVFPSRCFRHSGIYIRTDRGIRSPADLKGRVVGVPEYTMTAALWVRGILQDEYGIAPTDMGWRCGGMEQPGRSQTVAITPDGVSISRIGPGETLSAQLAEGRLDAVVAPDVPSAMSNPNVGRLFPDYRDVEAAWYRKTKLFPIMHVIGVRKSLVEKHPWLPVNVMKAFIAAKELCYHEMQEIGHLFTTLPWPVQAFEDARQLMGSDFWPYGVEPNLRELETMTRYSHAQGLSTRRIGVPELFAPSTYELAKR